MARRGPRVVESVHHQEIDREVASVLGRRKRFVLSAAGLLGLIEDGLEIGCEQRNEQGRLPLDDSNTPSCSATHARMAVNLRGRPTDSWPILERALLPCTLAACHVIMIRKPGRRCPFDHRRTGRWSHDRKTSGGMSLRPMPIDRRSRKRSGGRSKRARSGSYRPHMGGFASSRRLEARARRSGSRPPSLRSATALQHRRTSTRA